VSKDKSAHLRLSDLRGLQRLANDATVGLADLVEAMHHTIARTPAVVGTAPKGRTKGITGLVYRSVRGVSRAVGGGVDALLGLLAPLIAEKRSSQERETVLTALNGVLGDYLVASGNTLAITMRLRVAGVPLAIDRASLAAAFPASGSKVLVLMHGLCMNDLQWTRDKHDHGAALARDLGYTPIYLHYNSGRPISANGREFSGLMNSLVREWPYPIERLTFIGHSMGGLVARSACHHAALAGEWWLTHLDDLVFLGTPHFGAPLERAGTWADALLEISPYTAPFARLGKVRSAGIRDLRDGNLHDDAPQPVRAVAPRAADRLPLPEGVRCYAIAASKQQRPNATGTRIRGDGLVPVNSALGRHRDASSNLTFPESHRWVGYAKGHFDLLSDGAVYERIRSWLDVDHEVT
jgi:pimeloyl-ACP methyl ester carboxylesterase